MRKIPTVFVRDPEDMKRVLPEVTSGCEWVLAGEGMGTRKYDGTCVMFDGEAWWARREVKPGKPEPEGFVVAEHDGTTGKTVGWVPMSASPFAKWHAEALFDWVALCGEGPGEAGTYELCGPKINGNTESFEAHVLVPHKYAEVVLGPGGTYTFEVLREMVTGYGASGREGIVWHHPDGRMAKLKARDFPRVEVLDAA